MPFPVSFRYYSADGRRGCIRTTHDSGSPKLQAQFRLKLKMLAQLDFAEWREPLCKSLNGEGDGLIEIRFKVDGVQQRPLGFRSGLHEFTLLFWAIERGDKFVPKSTCATAQLWKQAVVSDRSLTDALWLALE